MPGCCPAFHWHPGATFLPLNVCLGCNKAIVPPAPSPLSCCSKMLSSRRKMLRLGQTLSPSRRSTVGPSLLHAALRHPHRLASVDLKEQLSSSPGPGLTSTKFRVRVWQVLGALFALLLEVQVSWLVRLQQLMKLLPWVYRMNPLAAGHSLVVCWSSGSAPWEQRGHFCTRVSLLSGSAAVVKVPSWVTNPPWSWASPCYHSAAVLYPGLPLRALLWRPGLKQLGM